ncbi:MAG: amino acid transporter [Bacilli bacterium]|nr:amino acid transporter [Bacilli bacterium]
MSLMVSWLHPMLDVMAVVAILYAGFNFQTVKRVLIGEPMRTRELHASHNRLAWYIALPILAADLYSSVAYGPEAGMTELVALGPSAKWLILPITAATVILLAMLIVSYIMGVMAYPNGGGAYAIAKDNFKNSFLALVAGSSLLIDYILTVAVSISSGVQNMASAYPILAPYQTTLALLCVFIILVVNLRGVSESAKVFSYPTVLFMVCMILLIFTGFANELRHGFVQPSTPPFGTVPQGITTMLILRAFSSACSALTGIETISNSVPILRDPQQKGAIKAYIALGLITAFTLLGFAYHLYVRGLPVVPNNTLLSQLTQAYFGHGVIYQVIIWSTLLVLIMAANSTFTGFPQLAALVAGDGFLPRALTLRGDRLGYSNGMIVLAALSALLIEAFNANTNALIPLYAIGVFIAFTVAQVGLTRRWFRVRGPKWTVKASINTFGAVITASVAVIFAVTKFSSGAWVVLIVLPILILTAWSIRRHYNHIAEELRIDVKTMRPESHRVVTIVLVSGIHRVVLNTISFAISMHKEVIAVYIAFNDESAKKMEQKWEEWGEPCRLVVIHSEYRTLLQPLARFLKRVETREGGRPDHIHLVIAQFIPKKWWHYVLHNQSSLLIRAWLIRHKDVVITTVPYHLHK